MRWVAAVAIGLSVFGTSCSSDSAGPADASSARADSAQTEPDAPTTTSTSEPQSDASASSTSAVQTDPSSTTTAISTTAPERSSSTTVEEAATTASTITPAAATCRAVYDEGTNVLVSGLVVLEAAFGRLTMQEITDLSSEDLDAAFADLREIDGFAEFDAARTAAGCSEIEFSSSDALCDRMRQEAASSPLDAELIDDYLEPLNC